MWWARPILDRYSITEDCAARQFWNWVQCLAPDDGALTRRSWVCGHTL